jgi:Vitamin K-dependent gamma-carboxylase
MKPSGWVSEERDAYLLGLMRVAFALLLLLFTLKLGRTLLTNGYFGDVFHLPLLPRSWVPSRGVYTAMLAVQASCCLLSLAGLWARPALLTAAALGFYGFLCDRLQYHNNRYCLLLLTCLVALSPCDRSFSLWRWLRRRPEPPRVAPRLLARALGAQLSLVYLSSSIGKALDADWRGGTVMLLRFAEGHALLSRYLPAPVADLLQAPWFSQAASLGAIGSELFIALGPWFVRTRALALWLGVVFHAGIELSANVELFSYTMLSGYVAFATPELCERRATFSATGRGPLLKAVLSRLDWLRRFQLELSASQREPLVVRDRAGVSHRGLAALRELTRATPALFSLWLPLALVCAAQRRGRGVKVAR